MRTVSSVSLGSSLSTLNNALCWSEDDNLSVVTTKGIYIYQLLMDPSNSNKSFNFKPTIIRNEENINPWQLNCGINQDELLESGINLHESNLIMMDKSISPHIESAKTSFRQYVLAGFTNLHNQTKSCLLITLTSDHWLKIYQYHSGKWQLYLDVSQTLNEILSANNWKIPNSCLSNSRNTFEVLKARSYYQATTYFEWSPFDNLITAQKNGKCLIWDKAMNNILCNHDTYFQIITFLKSFQISDSEFILFVCGDNGQIKCYMIKTRSSSNLSFNHLETMLWSECDNLRISALTITKHEKAKTEMEITISKENYLIMVKYNYGVKNNTDITHTSIIGGTRIVNTCELTNGFLLTICSNGKLKKVNNQEINEIFYECFPGVDSKNLECHGLIRSRGKSVIAMVHTISSYYDHLILRTPTRITFLTPFSSTQDIFRDIISLQSQEIVDLKDSLEVMRIMSLMDEKFPLENQLKISNPHLKIWFLRLILVNLDCDEDKSNVMNTLESEICQALGASKSIIQQIDSNWVCKICEGSAIASEASSVTCESGHNWPRCSLSLQICHEPNLLTCLWCKSIALPNFYKNVCPLCQGPYLF